MTVEHLMLVDWFVWSEQTVSYAEVIYRQIGYSDNYLREWTYEGKPNSKENFSVTRSSYWQHWKRWLM